MSDIQGLVLAKLGEGLPAITPAFGAALVEAYAVCLEDQGHSQSVELRVNRDFSTRFKLYWQTVTDQMLRCWNDQEYTTEQAAYGIALAETASLAKLRGDLVHANQLLRQAFEKETQAATLIANDLNAEPTRSVLHRSSASLAIDCGEIQTAERLIATALTGNPPKKLQKN